MELQSHSSWAAIRGCRNLCSLLRPVRRQSNHRDPGLYSFFIIISIWAWHLSSSIFYSVTLPILSFSCTHFCLWWLFLNHSYRNHLNLTNIRTEDLSNSAPPFKTIMMSINSTSDQPADCPSLQHSTKIAMSAFLNNRCTQRTMSAEEESIDPTTTSSSVGNTGDDYCVENTAEHLAVPARWSNLRNLRTIILAKS